jgi:hypothetical protein
MKRSLSIRQTKSIFGAALLFGPLLLLACPAPAAEVVETSAQSQSLALGDWTYGAYLDLGYAMDSNHPGNRNWRNKGTTFEVDEPKLNMAMAYAGKDTKPESRWGWEFGVQTGSDTDKLVPDPPPEANKPLSHADTYRHFYRANLSYLFPTGNGLKFTAGLINSYIGYESYHAIENPNYTRGYLLDNVPYFLVGFEALYPFSDTLNLALYTVSGWNYLANPNDCPSLGLQARWDASPSITFTQNLYYGPDQEETELEFWRVFSDSILEWKSDRFLLALALDVGMETQASSMGNPRDYWVSGALWAAWRMGKGWTLAVRPEFFYDPDGLITGSKQTLQAYTATLKYKLSPAPSQKLVFSAEYRYDRSTGSGGGFFRGSSNTLVPDQHLLIFALMWSFDK